MHDVATLLKVNPFIGIFIGFRLLFKSICFTEYHWLLPNLAVSEKNMLTKHCSSKKTFWKFSQNSNKILEYSLPTFVGRLVMDNTLISSCGRISVWCNFQQIIFCYLESGPGGMCRLPSQTFYKTRHFILWISC